MQYWHGIWAATASPISSLVLPLSAVCGFELETLHLRPGAGDRGWRQLLEKARHGAKRLFDVAIGRLALGVLRRRRPGECRQHGQRGRGRNGEEMSCGMAHELSPVA
jgi:hypothetical protein